MAFEFPLTLAGVLALADARGLWLRERWYLQL